MSADLNSTAEIRDYVTSAERPVAAVREAVMALIPEDLYAELTDLSGSLHGVGLVGLSEAIMHGRDVTAFLAVLDFYDKRNAR